MSPAEAMLSTFLRRTRVRLDWGLGNAKITEPVRRLRGVRPIKTAITSQTPHRRQTGKKTRLRKTKQVYLYLNITNAQTCSPKNRLTKLLNS